MVVAQRINEINTVSIKTGAGSFLKKLLLPNPVFELHIQDSRYRTKAEDYIAQHFNKVYGAQICSFLPTLMTMRCKSGFSAAVGMRSAAQGTLFLEQYLDAPIEKCITKHTDKTAHRNEVVEIGNLVSTQKGTSHLLFILIAAALIKTDNKWMVFTATGQVAKILHRLNFKTISLCEANQSRINQQDKQEQWGEYYSTRPQVLVGDLGQVFDLIHRNRLISYVVKFYDRTVCMLSNHFNQQSIAS